MGNYVNVTDFDNWPGNMSQQEKEDAITLVETRLEEIAGRHFYGKAFDIDINGNGKNRLFLGLEADVLTVTRIDVCGTELEESYWSFDNVSVFLDVCSSGAIAGMSVEQEYLLTETGKIGIFPRGYNNIRIVGSYGDTELFQLAKKACAILVNAANDPELYERKFKMEWIGDYRYDFPGVGQDGKTYTGIIEADDMIDVLISNKGILLTP